MPRRKTQPDATSPALLAIPEPLEEPLDMSTPPTAPRHARYIYRYTFTRHAIADAPGEPMDTPARAARVLTPMMDGYEREALIVAMLDRKQHVVAVEELYRGNVAGCSVRISEMFTAAVRLNACGILIAHNHPSGDPEPSGDDVRTTRDTVAAGRLLGIPLVDHIVVGSATRWVSLRERGII